MTRQLALLTLTCSLVFKAHPLPAQQLATDVESIRKIVLLPVVDARPSKKFKISLKGVRKRTRAILRGKHYVVTLADAPSADIRSYLEIRVDRISYQGQIPIASIAASISDSQTKRVLWNGRSTGTWSSSYMAPRAGQTLGDQMASATASVLADAVTLSFMRASARNDALSDAVFNLLNGPSGLRDLPKKKK